MVLCVARLGVIMQGVIRGTTVVMDEEVGYVPNKQDNYGYSLL